LIVETDIDRVFNADVIGELAKGIKTPPDAATRFEHDVRSAVRAYLAERARTNWKAIGEQIGDLYDGLLDKADRGSEPAAKRLAVRIGLIDQATRDWLERCARRQLLFPSKNEILDRGTRKEAIKRLRSILSYGQERVEGRKRPSGGRSRPTSQPLLRVPESSRGRPRDLAARELVQQLALTYLEATGHSPPRSVSLRSKGPFLGLVRTCFDLIGIPAGGTVDLINKREIARKKLKRPHYLRTRYFGLKEN
jgi:hypothetical protein